MGKWYLFNVYTFCKSLCVINEWSPYGLHGDPIYILYLYDHMWLVGVLHKINKSINQFYFANEGIETGTWVTAAQITWVKINQIRLREPLEIQTIHPKKYLTQTNELGTMVICYLY